MGCPKNLYKLVNSCLKDRDIIEQEGENEIRKKHDKRMSTGICPRLNSRQEIERAGQKAIDLIAAAPAKLKIEHSSEKCTIIMVSWKGF